MTLAAVIQARMRSTRLPGKVLREVGGMPILDHLLGRIRRARRVDLIVVATSTDPSDDPIVERCERLGVACHRGPLEDVAARFTQVVERYRLTAFVRVSADSPLLDPAVVDRVIPALEPGVDVATNVWPRTFPRGQSVEVVRSDAFHMALPLMRSPGDTEHVTSVLYRHPELFRVRNVRDGTDRSDLRMVVDDAADLDRLERVLAAMSRPAEDHGLDELVALYRACP